MLLADLHLSVAHKIVGHSPAEFFSRETGLHRKRWDRGTALPALLERLREGYGEDLHTALLLQLMAPPKAPTPLVPRGALDHLSGICAVLAHGLGVLDDQSSPATWDLIATFDAADRLLFSALENEDIEAFRRQFVPGAPLSSEYLTPLPVAESTLREEDRKLAQLVQRRRAHMALSYRKLFHNLPGNPQHLPPAAGPGRDRHDGTGLRLRDPLPSLTGSAHVLNSSATIRHLAGQPPMRGIQ